MLESILNTPYLQVARQALTGLSRRQEAIASNIANIDTPGYQRKTVTFEDALKAELTPPSGATSALPLRVTDPRHITATGAMASGDSIGGVQAQDVIATKNDSNSVDIDQEMTNLVDTQLRYQALSQTVGTRLQTLRTVINGQ
jgi:flagellar basal-body rod protein FlgB